MAKLGLFFYFTVLCPFAVVTNSFSLAHILRQIKELGWDLLTFDPDLIQGKISNCHLSFDIVKSLKKKFSQNFQ